MSGPQPPATTIMVVDDDDALRTIVCELLQSGGYGVLAARNALEAMQLSQTFHGRLDLIIVDVKMPLIGGVDLVARLKKKRPLRVLLMSGYPMVLDQGSAPQPRDAAFIQKPFTRDELLLKVRQVLGAKT